MTTSQPVLEVHAVSLRYGDHHALRGVSLTVERGRLVAVVGPNGAGKSSLVRAICGRAPLDAGQIRINGKNAQARAARACLGVAPQRAALYDSLTASENLVCFARMAGFDRARAEERADEILALIGMETRRRVRAGAMSGGMRQRINIGAAIAHKPALVVLDEPAANLDPSGVEEINRLIIRLKAEQYGIVLVTHDMMQAEQLADTVAVLRDGALQALAAPAELVVAQCGDALTLCVATAGNETPRLVDAGFNLDPARPDRWIKRLPNRAGAAEALQALEKSGVRYASAQIAAPTLADAVARLANAPRSTEAA